MLSLLVEPGYPNRTAANDRWGLPRWKLKSSNRQCFIRQRVDSWKVGVWDYMKAGFDAYAGTGTPKMSKGNTFILPKSVKTLSNIAYPRTTPATSRARRTYALQPVGVEHEHVQRPSMGRVAAIQDAAGGGE